MIKLLIAAASLAFVAPVEGIVAYAYDMGTCQQTLKASELEEFWAVAEQAPPELKEAINEAYYAGVEDAYKYPELRLTCVEALAESAAMLEPKELAHNGE